MAQAGTSRLLLGLMIAATAAIYLPRAGAPWVYEDTQMTADQRPTLAAWRVPSRTFTAAAFHATWRVAGYEPRLYRIVSLGLHLLVGVLVFAAARAMHLTVASALVATGILLWHPIVSATVSYVAAQGELWMTLGIVLATWCSLRPPSALAIIGMMGGLVVAAFSKETGLVGIPLVAMTRIVWQRRRPSGEARFNSLIGALALWGITILLIIAGLPLLSQYAQASPYADDSLTWPTFLLGQLTACWYVAIKLITLTGFSVDHDVVGLAAWWTVFAAACTVVSWGAILQTWRSAPLVAWGLLWFWIAIAPRFLFRTTEFMTEPHLYVALIGPVIVLAAAGTRLWAWRPQWPRLFQQVTT